MWGNPMRAGPGAPMGGRGNPSRPSIGGYMGQMPNPNIFAEGGYTAGGAPAGPQGGGGQGMWGRMLGAGQNAMGAVGGMFDGMSNAEKMYMLSSTISGLLGTSDTERTLDYRRERDEADEDRRRNQARSWNAAFGG